MADNNSIFERLEGTSLPAWSDIPDLDLYMDQVISLMKRYLGPLSASDDKGITSSMVNNYVKQGVMPAPKKKRYTKIHLVYLIMIYILKNALTMTQIRSLIESELSNQSLEELYTAFCEQFRSTAAEAAVRYRDTVSDPLSASTNAAIRAYIEQSVSASFI